MFTRSIPEGNQVVTAVCADRGQRIDDLIPESAKEAPMPHQTRPDRSDRMPPRVLTFLAAALLVLAVVGCGESSDDVGGVAVEAASTTEPSATTAPATKYAEIVGTYTRTATVEQGRSAGADDEFIETALAPDGLEIKLELLADESWNLLMDNCHCDVFERGDFGTYTFDDEGRLVATSENTESRGWSAVIEWELDGDVLTFASADGYRGEDGPFPLDPIETIMMLGEYTRLNGEESAEAAPSFATTPGWESDVEPFLAALEEGGDAGIALALDVEWMDDNAGEDVEQRIITAVASGELHAGYVGVRALSALGVDGFDALVAPRLVDSYELQEAVLDSDIPDRLLPAIDEFGLTGLAIVAGPMRYPLGIDRPYVGPDDFAGSTFHTFPAAINTATAEALGSTHSQQWGGERDDAIDDGTIDVTENTLTWMNNNGRGSHATLDALWPATAVLVVNNDFLAGLSDAQINDLRSVIDDSRRSADDLRAIETTLVEELCEAGKQFVTSSADQLTAMRDALQPVYDMIATDPSAGALLDEIEAMKPAVVPEPRQLPDGCAGTSSAHATAEGTDVAAAIDGAFQLEWTLEELMSQLDADEGTARGNAGVYVLTFDDGQFTQFWEEDPEFTCAGTYGIAGDRLKLVASRDLADWECGAADLGALLVDAAWRIESNQLVLSDFVRSTEPDVTWWYAGYLATPLTRLD
jgi:TRAP-type transport system periplasmic protein